MDSDLEDKIMSMVQYGSGISKKKTSAPAAAVPTTETQDVHPPEQSNVQASVVYAPVDDATDDSQKTAVSSANIYQIDETDSEDDAPTKTVYSDEDDEESEDEEKEEEEEEDVGVPELTADVPAKTPVHEPQVTRFINLDEEEKRYMDDEDTSEEEAELESKLQQLIDDQVGQHTETETKRDDMSNLERRSTTVKARSAITKETYECASTVIRLDTNALTASSAWTVVCPSTKIIVVLVLVTAPNVSIVATMLLTVPMREHTTVVDIVVQATTIQMCVLVYCMRLQVKQLPNLHQPLGATTAMREAITVMSVLIYRNTRLRSPLPFPSWASV